MKFSNRRELQKITSNHSLDIDFKDFMKHNKYYNKELFLVLVNDTTLTEDNPLRFKKNFIK